MSESVNHLSLAIPVMSVVIHVICLLRQGHIFLIHAQKMSIDPVAGPRGPTRTGVTGILSQPAGKTHSLENIPSFLLHIWNFIIRFQTWLCPSHHRYLSLPPALPLKTKHFSYISGFPLNMKNTQRESIRVGGTERESAGVQCNETQAFRPP